MTKLRPIAINLPQFHPIAQNDEWWGKGFTEWTNVTKATPRFKGHNQPQLPTDMGFYDLRLHEARVNQATLAKEYGIEGFCYYHYWFSGEVLLEQPLEGLLKNPEPSLPFCMCWANENWTRNWDGKFAHVLKEQKYSLEDDKVHIHYLLPFFKDMRYLRVDGKPVFIIYRPQLFPDIKQTLDLWREEARKADVGDLYLMYFESFGFSGQDPKTMGFDACIEFQPRMREKGKKIQPSFVAKVLNKLKIKESPFKKDMVYSYEEYSNRMIVEKPFEDYKRYPGIFPDWDNSPRREKEATIFHGSTPTLFGKWLKSIIEKFKPYSPDENFIFINAWNEWAEGNHLEPCRKWGRGYLEEVKKVFKKAY